MADEPDSWLMWEVRAVPGRLAELASWADRHADGTAQLFASDGPEPRLVVITPQLQLPEPPVELVARPAHAWTFRRLARAATDRPVNSISEL